MKKLLPILLIAGIGIGAFFLLKKKDKRAELYRYTSTLPSQGDQNVLQNAIANMTPAELDVLYSFIFDYYTKGLQAPASMQPALDAISVKYNIFT